MKILKMKMMELEIVIKIIKFRYEYATNNIDLYK
jgi:hypothetical protein